MCSLCWRTHAATSERFLADLLGGHVIYAEPFRRIRSSLEAGIDLILPNVDQLHPFVQLLRREGESRSFSILATVS